MIKLTPIIAVKNVATSAQWYKEVFGLRNALDNEHFGILKSDTDEIILNLHKWQSHSQAHHQTLSNPDITPGNGLLLYFRTNNLQGIRENLEKVNAVIESEIYFNHNTQQQEFSCRDLDGYLLTITEEEEFER